jgi:hypothetical protein
MRSTTDFCGSIDPRDDDANNTRFGLVSGMQNLWMERVLSCYRVSWLALLVVTRRGSRLASDAVDLVR